MQELSRVRIEIVGLRALLLQLLVIMVMTIEGVCESISCAQFLCSFNHKARMRSNCIEICNKLLLLFSLSSYDDLYQIVKSDAQKAEKKVNKHRPNDVLSHHPRCIIM